MFDFTALQAGAEYRRDEFVHEAAHGRLIRPLPPTTARPTPRDRLGSLIVARTVLFLVIAVAGLSAMVGLAPAASAPLAARQSAALQPSMPVDLNAAGLGCGVPGDVVWSREASAGNSAAVAQTKSGATCLGARIRVPPGGQAARLGTTGPD